MVGDKDDYRIFPCRQFLERINEIADTAVRIRDGGLLGMLQMVKRDFEWLMAT